MTKEPILVVDDEAAIRDIVQTFLKRANYQVTTATNGREALALCERHSFALVLTDLKMPEMGGEELLRRLQTRAPETDVIILTGYPTLKTAIETLKAGAYDYLVKPFQLVDLRHTVERCLERQQLRRERDGERHLRLELQRVSTALRNAEEKERGRIARELHDGVIQTLAGARIYLGLAEKELDETSTAQTHIQQASDILSQAMTEMRQLIWTLRPTALDDMGLVPALHELVNTFATKSSVTISLQGDEHLPHLPPATETALYRIAQEAIANSLQHAQATQISVALRQHQETIHLTIIDDGTRTTKRSPSEVNSENREPHPHLRGLGLWSMQERAAEIGGTFSIHTIPGQGTEVMVSAPLNQGRTPR